MFVSSDSSGGRSFALGSLAISTTVLDDAVTAGVAALASSEYHRVSHADCTTGLRHQPILSGRRVRTVVTVGMIVAQGQIVPNLVGEGT